MDREPGLKGEESEPARVFWEVVWDHLFTCLFSLLIFQLAALAVYLRQFVK